MRIRILYFVKVIMSYLKIFKFSFDTKSFNYAAMFIHGMIYLEGQVNCKKIADSWFKKINNQRLSDFLNHGVFDLNSLNYNRINHALNFSLKENTKDYALFSIDPSNFKKYKGKKTQKVRYASEGSGTFLCQTLVLSSIIIDNTCIPFKKKIYEGKNGESKPRIYQKLSRKFEKFDINNLKRIAVFDGEGCTKKNLPYFHKSQEWEGFVTKFPRTRCITLNEQRIHIRKYLETLTEKDFVKSPLSYYHFFQAKVPSLDFLGNCNFLVLVDDLKDLVNKSKVRVLITDILELPLEEFLSIYIKRWKQETYHQIIKDRLGCRSYKFRKVKAIMRFLELGDLSYSFLEMHKQLTNQKSVCNVRNKFIDDYALEISNKLGLKLPKTIAKTA